jgi:predicted LPLAT superfamily acyltransferase
VETAVEMKDAIGRGELVIMAGDRVSAGSKAILRHRFLGRDCVWPKGVYRFAKLMESPVFAVTCVRTGWNRYEVHFSALGKSEPVMLDGFVSFLERETVAYPEQWYQFYDFFGFAT